MATGVGAFKNGAHVGEYGVTLLGDVIGCYATRLIERDTRNWAAAGRSRAYPG